MLPWLRNPRLIWNSFQYLSGLRDSRLIQLTKRPAASYRAVAYGVPEDQWEAFEAAYPEYEMIFTKPDIMAAELRLALAARNTVLLAFDGAPRRLIQVACRQLNVQVFQASYAPLPILERNGEVARGFLIDSMGDWLKARRPTELSIFLENFDISGRKQLMAAAKHLLAASTPLSMGDGCLILPSFTASTLPQGTEEPGDADLRTVAADYATPDQWVFFRGNRAEGWAAPEVVFDFLNTLQNCKTVVVGDNPLGILAVLAGREVVVSGRPFWAGFGLTKDLSLFKRRRNLSGTDLVALLVFVLSRYVDETNRLIDPADDWALPSHAHSHIPAFADLTTMDTTQMNTGAASDPVVAARIDEAV